MVRLSCVFVSVMTNGLFDLGLLGCWFGVFGGLVCVGPVCGWFSCCCDFCCVLGVVILVFCGAAKWSLLRRDLFELVVFVS